MQTVTVDIINEKAMYLLKDLELLQLIRLRKNKTAVIFNSSKYKGSMSKQSLLDLDNQLNDIRNGWE